MISKNKKGVENGGKECPGETREFLQKRGAAGSDPVVRVIKIEMVEKNTSYLKSDGKQSHKRRKK